MNSPISNHPIQKKIWLDKTRFKVWVAGRRTGKTTYAREKLTKVSCFPRHLYWYVAPTRGLAKDLLWMELKDRWDQLGWAYDKDETALSIIRKKTRTQLTLKSAENDRILRGKGLNGLIIDECADIAKERWTEALRPALSDKRGWADFLGTPKGFNWFHGLYQDAFTRKGWVSYQSRTIDSPFFQTPEGLQEIEDARRDLDERTFRQEYEASFETFAGRICHAFNRSIHHIDYEYTPGVPVIVGQDFNVLPMSSTFFQKVKAELLQFGEMSLNTSSTEETCREIRRRFPTSEIIVRPDASGARRTANSNVSDHQIMQQHGFKLEVGKANPGRAYRWAAQNRAFERKQTLINVKNCPKTTKDLETLCYKEGTCEPDLSGKDAKLKGHLFDAHGYAVYREFPILEKKESRTSYYA